MNTWKRVRLVDLCEAHVDCVNRTAPIVDAPTPYKMIRTTNVRAGFIDTNHVKYVTEDTYRRWTRRLVPRRGDIVLTREAPLGEVGKLRTDEPIFLGQRLYHFRADPGIADGDFLMYALMGPELQSQIRSFGSGATVEHMRLPHIEKLELDAPDLKEQRRIAGTLSAYDDLIDNCERRIRVLDEMARALYREWFVLYRYPGHEKVPLVDSPLGRIPKRWVARSVKDLAAVTYGWPFKSALFSTDPSHGTPVVRIRDIPGGASSTFTSENADKRYLIERGDILVGMDGDFHMNVWSDGPAFQNQRVARFRPANGWAPLHLLLALEAPIRALNRAIVGTTVAHLGDMHVRDICLAEPPADLMERSRRVFEAMGAETQTLEQSARNLRQTRDLLLPRLLSGKLSVNEAA